MTVCCVCGTSQGPFLRDLPRSGLLERVVMPNKPYCRDAAACMKRREREDKEKDQVE